MKVYPVILSGGAGTRLWPLSRELYPKQLLALSGGHTLLQEAALRARNLASPTAAVESPIVVTGEDSRFLVKEQLADAGLPSATILLEPFGRNTAPALTLAAHEVESRGGGLMFVLPADHLILDKEVFRKAAMEAVELAGLGKVAMFGVPAKNPATSYGYIRKGDRITGAATALHASAFTEKPDAASAEGYCSSGEYFWNSGMFVFSAAWWLAEVGRLRPDMAAVCRDAYGSARRDGTFCHIGAEAFEKCPAESIDRAALERLCVPGGDCAAVVPLDAGWSDAGSWEALWDMLEKDSAGNVAQGDVFVDDTANSLLISEGRFLAALGLRDVFVVETSDAVLVVKKTHSQEVRKVVEWLKERKRSEHISHQRVFRPWGYYQGVDEGERYQVKRIMVKPGESLSLQLHRRRAEHWIVVKGKAKVTCGERVFELAENESTYIPLGVKHRLENPGAEPLEMIEVQSGGYLGEDDIVRFEDRYNRS